MQLPSTNRILQVLNHLITLNGLVRILNGLLHNHLLLPHQQSPRTKLLFLRTMVMETIGSINTNTNTRTQHLQSQQRL